MKKDIIKKKTMKELTFQQKIELINAVVLVADFWAVEPSELVGFTALFTKPEKREEWNSIAKEVAGFSKMDLVDRAKKLGFNFIKSN